MFYVGNDVNFDIMVKKTLKRLKNIYPFITYYVVLAYLPCINKYSQEELNDTVFPDGLKKVLPKYAIVQRNMWMI